MQNVTPKPKDKQLCDECLKYAINCLGKSFVFTSRVKFYNGLITLITAIGILIPALVGAIAISYGVQQGGILIVALSIAIPLSVFQFFLSGISLAFKWPDRLAYSLESATANKNLSEDFKILSQFPPSGLNELEQQYKVLIAKESSRSDQDDKYPFSDTDNRKGMRYALYIFKNPCASCGKTPTSKDVPAGTKCDTCANF